MGSLFLLLPGIAARFYFMSILKRKKIVHEKYYVYRLKVGEYYYYGITNNTQERHDSHCYNIIYIVEHPNVVYKTGNWLQKSQFKLAESLKSVCKKQKVKGSVMIKNFIKSSICFETDSQDEAREVESYLIKKSNPIYCCNK